MLSQHLCAQVFISKLLLHGMILLKTFHFMSTTLVLKTVHYCLLFLFFGLRIANIYINLLIYNKTRIICLVGYQIRSIC